MKVLVVANAKQKREILVKPLTTGVEVVFVEKDNLIEISDEYDALFYLPENADELGRIKIPEKPVFINSVNRTLAQYSFPENVYRINAWPGFLARPVWEVASKNTLTALPLFDELGWEVIFVKDEPGLVAARVISMIINEAFFALGENVSNKDDIDNAMKLGTHYPFGPFEWLEQIGVQSIYQLLHKMAEKNNRYSIAPLLEKKYFELISSL